MAFSLWTIGCCLGASGVAFGAFGAHALKRRVFEQARIKSWETACHYQLLHSIPILISAQTSQFAITGYLMSTGVLLFSGSIYGLVLRPNWKFLGPITPLGGVLLIAGWISLMFSTSKSIVM